MTFGSTSEAVDQASKNYSVTVGEENYRKLLESGLVYKLNVPIKNPGGYQFRVALRDAHSGKIGSTSQFVSIPDLDQETAGIVRNCR